jgi:hypothetical protein
VSGYGYIYQKRISLVAGKPQMEISHHLRNTGTRPLHTTVYDHNFLVLDKRVTDDGYSVTVPFTITSTHPPEEGLAEIRKNQIQFLKTFTGEDRVYTTIDGFGGTPADYHIHIVNSHAKAGLTITADRPLAKMALWSIRSNVSVEPFVEIAAAPGEQTGWKYTYAYETHGR